MVHLRPATPADGPFVLALSGEGFGRLGDYASIMRGWFEHPGVLTTIAEVDGAPAGYVMLALIRRVEGRPPEPDIVGVVVAEGHRRAGVGRALLRHAAGEGERLAGLVGADAVWLSVAEDNDAARALFRAEGFEDTGRDDVRYPGGQRCLRMARRQR